MDRISNWTPSSRISGLLSFRKFHALLLILTGLMGLLFIAGVVRFLPVTGENVYPESAGVLCGTALGKYRSAVWRLSSATLFDYSLSSPLVRVCRRGCKGGSG